MTFNDYQSLASSTDNNHPDKILNHILGLCGEAGETAELIKKYHFHGTTLSKENLSKELGDCLWYLTMLAEDFGLSFDAIAEANIMKLKNRYPKGFVKGGGIR